MTWLFIIIIISFTGVTGLAWRQRNNVVLGALVSNLIFLGVFYFLAALIASKVFQNYDAPTRDAVTTRFGKKYVIGNFLAPVHIYTDRNYTLFTDSIRNITNADAIISTANEDKNLVGGDVFSIRLSGQNTTSIYVVHDIRAETEATGGIPGWLAQSGFKTDSTSSVVTTEHIRYHYFRKIIQKGQADTITFGGNLNYRNPNTSDYSMYFVLLTTNKENVENTNVLWGRKATEKLKLTRQTDTLYSTPHTPLPVSGTGWPLAALNEKLNKHEAFLLHMAGGKRFDLNFRLSDTVKWVKNVVFAHRDFSNADFNGRVVAFTQFMGCRMTNVEFFNSKLYNNNFYNVVLNNSNFGNATIGSCRFFGADLQNVNFVNARLDKQTDFSYCDMAGVIFEPDSLPGILGMANAYNLDLMTYQRNPSALIQLRQELQKAGFEEAQHKVTAAIRRRANQLESKPIVRIADRFLFDYTCGYGTDGTRPLLFVVILTYLFLHVYLVQFFLGKLGLSIYVTEWSEQKGTFAPVNKQIKVDIGKVLFLALVSSIAIGFGEFKFDEWIKKLYPKEYSLETNGFTRVMVGIQGIICLFLFALAALIFFGDPFNQ